LTIRARLLWLTLGLVVPLVVVGFINLWSTRQVSREQLNESVEQQAELAATAFDQWIEAQKQTLVTIKDLTENNQSPLTLKDYLNSIIKTRPHWLDVQIIGAGGEAKLSQSTKDRPLPLISTEIIRAEIEQRKTLVIFTDQFNDEKLPVLSLAYPLTGGDFVVARIDGAGASRIFEQIELPAEHTISVFDFNNRLLYRNRISPEQLAQEVNNTPLLSVLNEKSSGTIEIESPYDNIGRVYGLAKVEDTGYKIAVGVPSSRLYEPARRQFTSQALFGSFITVLAVLLAFLMARSIAGPIRNLSNAAKAFGEGDLSARAEISRSGTIRELGETFNQMAEQIAHREEELKKLDRLKSEFVSSVSHELRTPLTTIKTLTRVLQRNNIPATEREEYLKTIAVECDRQIDFVQNLLDLSRIESGAYRVKLTETDIIELLENCLASQKPTAAAQNLELRFDAPKNNLPPALTDTNALRRIILSLLENAVKYTPEGGEIRISAGQDDGKIIIRISDTGCGIAPEDLPHIFEKFYRGKALELTTISALDREQFKQDDCSTSHEATGVGLGLYLVKSLVDQIGGEISAESPVSGTDHGTKFTLSVPAVSNSI
jgi:signal transduction histidine kinase